MPSLHAFAGATYLLQILVSAFLAILFLQAGINKVADRRGDVEWLKGHFAKSLLAGTVPGALIAITMLEFCVGALSGVCFAVIIFSPDSTLGVDGALLYVIAVVALFVGE